MAKDIDAGKSMIQLGDLDSVSASATPFTVGQTEREPFEFKSKPHLVEYLRQGGYEVTENKSVTGRSGIEHNLDMLATMGDGIVMRQIAIGMSESAEQTELNKMVDFDAKACYSGIWDKIFIAAPALGREARQLAERQQIKIFEARELGGRMINSFALYILRGSL